MSTSRRRVALSALTAAAGAVLFAYAVRRVGGREIVDGIRRVGWGFIPILGLAGLRFGLRAAAWRQCTAPDQRLAFREAFTAFVAGDAVGSVTPLGLVASEPAKVLLIRRHLETRDSVASLALDNLLYAGSALTMIGLGIIVMLSTVPLPIEWEEWALVGLAVVAGAAVVGVVILHRRVPAPEPGTGWRASVRRLQTSVLQFSAGHPSRLWRAFAFDMTFHGLAVGEAYLTLLWLLGERSPTLAQAIVFEALNRLVTVVFKFVPFRVGVDEAISGAFAPLLAVSPAAGVSLAVIRKVRNLFWTGVGLAFIGARQVEPAPLPDSR